MKPYLKLVIQRYLIIAPSLSFFCILLSPHIQKANIDNILQTIFALFIYRINIISIFSLLFATLTTIQTYEKQNIAVALSMSGLHSFKIMRSVLYFAFFLSFSSLFVNQFFLGSAIKTLKRDKFLTSNNENLQVHQLDNCCVFYTNNLENFTHINSNKDIMIARYGSFSQDGINLFYVDHFRKKDNKYEKIESNEFFHLNINPAQLKVPTNIKNSDSLVSFYKALITTTNEEKPIHSKIKTLFFYRLLLPFLHLFAVSLAALFGFSYLFRQKPYLALFFCILSSLYFFYLLECSSILGEGHVISPLYFIVTALILPVLFPISLYIKKV